MSNRAQARAKAIAILPKFSGFFSICGSGFIIYDILISHFNIEPDWWRKKKENDCGSGSGSGSGGFRSRSTTMASARGRSSRRFAQRKTLKNSAYYRLMLAMSCSDFFVSFAWFFTTWPIPKDETAGVAGDPLYGNVGNTQTCTAQAFFIQLGIITPFYNALLACYYYLTIRREWKEKDFKCRIEYAGHFVSISFGFGTAIAGLVKNLFNNSRVWCWISSYPVGCGNGPDQEPCIRGKNSKVLRWVFYYGPLWVMIFLVAVFMAMVYAYVRGLDNKMNQYTAAYRTNANASSRNSADTGSGEMGPAANSRRRSLVARTFSSNNPEALTEQRRQRRNERSKAVANQGLFYAGTFALVWVFGTIVRAMQLAGASVPWGVFFWFAVLTPSQGFFNFLVYVRPRLIKYFEERKKRRKDRNNSKSGGSFNSDILHVSGISGHSSSNEVTGINQNRDTSTKSDLDLSEPFTKPNPQPSRSERNAKVRFAVSGRNLVKFEDQEPKDSQYSTKVQSRTDDNNIIKGQKKKDVDPTNAGFGMGGGSTELDISEAESEETIDPELLLSTSNGEELKRQGSPAAKDEVVGLHNATIDLATGEVRTRNSLRAVTPS